MIDPVLAASAVSTGLDLLRDFTEPEPEPSDVVNQQDFLTLLITQLQNQDPLDPVSSENFSAQLAQFSSLEQLTQINEKIDGIAQPGTGAPSQFEMLSLLGREVLGLGSTVTVSDGVASTLDFDLASTGAVRADIIDSSGQQVGSVDLGSLPAGRHEFDLATVSDGPALADGAYTVLVSQIEGETAIPLQTLLRGRVTGVDFASDPPALLLGDTRITLEDVGEIHESQDLQDS